MAKIRDGVIDPENGYQEPKKNIGTIPSGDRGSVTTGDQRAESVDPKKDRRHPDWHTFEQNLLQTCRELREPAGQFGKSMVLCAHAAVTIEKLDAQRIAMFKALSAASLALRSYQYGNASTELAEEIADACDAAIRKAGGSLPIEPSHEPGG